MSAEVVNIEQETTETPAYTLQPIGTRVLVRQYPEKEKEGSILIPEQAKEKPLYGDVLEVGEGATRVKQGDVVLFHAYAGIPLPKDIGERLLMIMEDELLAILKRS